MNLIDLGARQMIEKIGLSLDVPTVGTAILGLFDNSKGQIDFGSFVVSIAANRNVSSLLKAWLEDNGDHSISASDIMSIFGPKKIACFAGQLDIDPPSAALGLASALPTMIESTRQHAN